MVNALKLIGGKWKIAIIYTLRGDPVRFGELKRTLSPITQQMLTKQLRELERDLLIDRTVFEVIPPKVEYSLTEFGQSFMPVMESLCNWSTENQALMEVFRKEKTPRLPSLQIWRPLNRLLLLKVLIELQ